MRSPREPLDRADKLQRLKAFGLWIRGGVTLYQIAERLDIVAQNPSTAVGRARTKIEQGWRIVAAAKVSRWDAHWSGQFPGAAWQYLSGARLKTHPRKPIIPPPPAPSPLEQLLARIAGLATESDALGFRDIGQGLRNLCSAARYNHRSKEKVG